MLGKNLKTSIVNILMSLMTNTVAAQYSWVGAKKKRAFFELEIVKVIQGKDSDYTVYNTLMLFYQRMNN